MANGTLANTTLPGVAATTVPAPVSAPAPKETTARNYGQCGGIGFKGPTKCPEGFACVMQGSNAYYSQCLPGTLPANDSRAAANAPVEQAAYAQCGGLGFKGSNVCTAGTICTAQAGNIYFSQCLPVAQPPAPAAAPVPTSMAAAAPVSASVPSSASTAAPSSSTPVMMRRADPAPAAVYAQCGGIGWTGATKCATGSTCVAQPNNQFYSQCMPTTMETSKVNGVETSTVVVPFYGQCGGQGWTGPTKCAENSFCMAQQGNVFYSQCIPTFDVPSRRDLINAKTSVVLNDKSNAVPAAPAPQPEEPDTQIPDDVPSLEPAKLDNTVAVVPRPSLSASPSASPSTTTSASGPEQTLYGQCGGQDYNGATNCGDSAKCYDQDDFYSQCLPLKQQLYAQCGGDNYNGPTECTSGGCVELRPGYKQCQPSPSRRGIVDADTSVIVNPGPAAAAAPAPAPVISKTVTIGDSPDSAQKDTPAPVASQPAPQPAPPADTGATQQVYGQCGGAGYSGPTKCEDGSQCYKQKNGNNYSQCLPTLQQAYGQCGGKNYAGPTRCEEGSRCSIVRLGYSQCIPNRRRDDGSPYVQQPNSIPEAPAPAPPTNGSASSDYVAAAAPSSAPPAPSSNVTTPMVQQAASMPAPAPMSAPAPQPQPQVAQIAPSASPMAQVAQPAPQPQVVQPAPQPQVSQPAPQPQASQPPAPSKPTYETEETKVKYNPMVDSLVKSPFSLLGQTSSVYAACGGIGFQGNTICEAGSKCYTQNEYYSQCLPLVVPMYQQCGGGSYFGSNECVEGGECRKLRSDYFQCLPPSSKTRRAMEDPLKMLGGDLVKTSGMYGQCGGTGWTGPKLCQAGAKCTASGPSYSQCLPDDSPIGKLAGKLNGGIKPPKLALPDLAPKPAMPSAAAGGAAAKPAAR